MHLEPVNVLFSWWLNPPKQGLFQSKQGSFNVPGIYTYMISLEKKAGNIRKHSSHVACQSLNSYSPCIHSKHQMKLFDSHKYWAQISCIPRLETLALKADSRRNSSQPWALGGGVLIFWRYQHAFWKIPFKGEGGFMSYLDNYTLEN